MNINTGTTTQRNAASAYVLLGGLSSLVIAMGVGRFAYTPLLPMMQQEYRFGMEVAGTLASSNYVGYLLGALLATYAATTTARTLIFRLCLVLSIGTTAAMVLHSSVIGWLILRLIAGIASAGVFVIGSAIVLDALTRCNATHWSGVTYSGVGIGITGTGLAAIWFSGNLSVGTMWIVFALLCLPFALASWYWVIDDAEEVTQSARRAGSRTDLPPLFIWVIAAYFCEGLGYIVSGTFLVAIVQAITNSPLAGNTTWIVAGLAAAPSTVVWSHIARRIGFTRALVTAYGAQALGVVLPVLSQSLLSAYMSAILFGGTFMGITVLSITLGKTLVPERSGRTIGLLTTVYGAGQILGPLFAGALAERTHNLALPLVPAALVIAIGGIFLVIGVLRHSRSTHQRWSLPT